MNIYTYMYICIHVSSINWKAIVVSNDGTCPTEHVRGQTPPSRQHATAYSSEPTSNPHLRQITLHLPSE